MRSTEPDLFALRESGNIYTRLQNPTTDMLEKRVAALEGGPAALAVSSGHSAQLVALTSILSPGDNFVSSPYLYGGTHNQFKIVLRNFGLECRFAPDNDPQHMESLIDPRTRRSMSRRSAIRASPCPISARLPRLHGATTFR